MVGPGRFERPTSPLSGVRSNQLSYGPGTPEIGAATTTHHRQAGTGGAHAPNGRDLQATTPDGGAPFGSCKARPFRFPWADVLTDIQGAGPRPAPRKEVIQPQVPLRLPCYDFTPVADPTVDGCLLTVSTPASG